MFSHLHRSFFLYIYLFFFFLPVFLVPACCYFGLLPTKLNFFTTGTHTHTLIRTHTLKGTHTLTLTRTRTYVKRQIVRFLLLGVRLLTETSRAMLKWKEVESNDKVSKLCDFDFGLFGGCLGVPQPRLGRRA